jgi:hypothetical protein
MRRKRNDKRPVGRKKREITERRTAGYEGRRGRRQREENRRKEGRKKDMRRRR